MVRIWESVALLVKRINVPITASSTPAQIAAAKEDPWSQSGKYALGWVYLCIILVGITAVIRFYYIWGDKIRIAFYKEDRFDSISTPSDSLSAATDSSTAQFFPAHGPLPQAKKQQSSISTITPFNNAIAFLRWVFYRPIPVLSIWRFQIVFPSLGVSVIVLAALTFVTLYCFVPRPLYYASITYGSPPLAIRAGMIAVSMIPWLVALSTKANFISMITGISHERLNVLHRWGGYVCLFLSLIHTIPFYVTPIWEDDALANYQRYLPQNIYVYGTGLAALVPLIFLCIHSLPILRARMYELFVFLHLPVSIIFVAMLFWHCKNFLSSWSYLWATVAIWSLSCFIRLFYLNWTNPFRLSFLTGEDCTVMILPGNAIKITVPTRLRWRPGQYVYLRMPGISVLESHPFTIASLCTDDFPSSYGEKYRDMALVFRPFRGFTRKVLLKGLEKGPYEIYTAFLEGPYGGMQREMAAFDDVVFIAGGSGITAIASHLLSLIKKMRDGKAVTKSVRVIWALKSVETMEWFKEELRICREFAPPNAVHCHFFLTGLRPEQQELRSPWQSHQYIGQEKETGVAREIGQRDHPFTRGEPPSIDEMYHGQGNNETIITPLPQAYTIPHVVNSRYYNIVSPYTDPTFGTPSIVPYYDLSGLPKSPPTSTVPTQERNGWQTSYTRPDIPHMLQDFSRTFGRRTCVFVCGPPSMRVEVSKTVARLQQQVIGNSERDEIFLHAENYNI